MIVNGAEVSIGDAAFTFPFHCHSSVCSTIYRHAHDDGRSTILVDMITSEIEQNFECALFHLTFGFGGYECSDFTPCKNHNELNLNLLRHTLANRGRIADMMSSVF